MYPPKQRLEERHLRLLSHSFGSFKNPGIPLPPHQTVRDRDPNHPISMHSKLAWPS